MTTPVILAVCGDPGGANALAPIITFLQKKFLVKCITYAYHEAPRVLQEHGLTYFTLPTKIDANWIVDCFEKNHPCVLITATSHNALNWEKPFILAARQLAIFSLSILDFWSNYALRFSEKNKDLAYLPNKIAVMDRQAQEEMITEGIPADLIIITGQPAFDSLLDYKNTFSVEKKELVRSSLNIQQNELLVLFASQPLKKLYQSSNDLNYPGYDEDTVLHEVIQSLETISRKNNRQITLLIRPHPRETLNDYQHYHSKQINIKISVTGSSRDLLMSADLVLGMTTILLLEACYLQCIVISLQPGLKEKDTLRTNALGFSLGIYCQEAICSTLENYLLDKSLRQAAIEKTAKLKPNTRAAECVGNYLFKYIKVNT